MMLPTVAGWKPPTSGVEFDWDGSSQEGRKRAKDDGRIGTRSSI